MSNDSFSLSEYPEYMHILRYVIGFFLQKRNKIPLLAKVDEEVGHLFKINPAYASKFRKFFFPDSKRKCNTRACDKRVNDIKIGPFNYKEMESICRDYGILIPDEVRNKIVVLSSFALQVSEILNNEIYADIKRKEKDWIKEIDKIMENNPNLEAAIYMYLHEFREKELVWWLLATLPSIDKEKIRKWIDMFNTARSEKPMREIEKATKEWSFLFDFKNKLPRLNHKNLENVYSSISGFDLFCAYIHIDYFKQFARTPLRQDDIYLTYLIMTMLDQEYQEMMLDIIATASKADISLKRLPENEIVANWKTRTALSVKWMRK